MELHTFRYRPVNIVDLISALVENCFRCKNELEIVLRELHKYCEVPKHARMDQYVLPLFASVTALYKFLEIHLYSPVFNS